jgi:hypothetical protein
MASAAWPDPVTSAALNVECVVDGGVEQIERVALNSAI